MSSSSDLVTDVLIAASKLGNRLFRRNVGLGWIGQATKFNRADMITVRPGDVLIRNARPFHNGEVGQSDTYGWKCVLITQEMVGTVIAQHAELEVKFGTGRETKEQRDWRECVNRAGGIAGVARSVEDVRLILG